MDMIGDVFDLDVAIDIVPDKADGGLNCRILGIRFDFPCDMA